MQLVLRETAAADGDAGSRRARAFLQDLRASALHGSRCESVVALVPGVLPEEVRGRAVGVSPPPGELNDASGCTKCLARRLSCLTFSARLVTLVAMLAWFRPMPRTAAMACLFFWAAAGFDAPS